MKQIQLKNHPDFQVDGKWVQKFTQEKGVVWTTRSGVLWTNLTQRCKTGGSLQQVFPSYSTCKNHFKDFQEFAEWCQHQVGYLNKDSKGRYWQLDKDILKKGNKVYSPDLCVFVPKAVNCMLEKAEKKRGEWPIGVHSNKSRFVATVLRGVLGEPTLNKSFATPLEAFMYYKEHKENYIKRVAEEYKEIVDPRVYTALMNYQVDIED